MADTPTGTTSEGATPVGDTLPRTARKRYGPGCCQACGRKGNWFCHVGGKWCCPRCTRANGYDIDGEQRAKDAAQAAKEQARRERDAWAANVRHHRKLAGYSCDQLAQMSGISAATIKRIEQAHCLPNYSILRDIAHALRLPLPVLGTTPNDPFAPVPTES